MRGMPYPQQMNNLSGVAEHQEGHRDEDDDREQRGDERKGQQLLGAKNHPQCPEGKRKAMEKVRPIRLDQELRNWVPVGHRRSRSQIRASGSTLVIYDTSNVAG